MALKVDVYSMGEHRGTIKLDGNMLTANPPDSKLLRRVLSSPVFLVTNIGMKRLYARDNQKKWICTLYEHYKSYALNITKVVEDTNNTATFSTDSTTKKISVRCDWDNLRSVVVGRIENNVIAPAPWQPSIVGLPKEGEISYEDFAPREYKLAIKQLDSLCEMLESEKVTIYRPPVVSIEEAMRQPVGLTQMYARESFTVVGDKVLVNQCRTPYRRKEAAAITPFLAGTGVELVILPPVPDNITDSSPDDPLPYIEGGDVYRMGSDYLVTISGLATSPAGFRYLADEVTPNTQCWVAYLTSRYEHGDYILMLVREGLCVACRRGFVDGLLPSPITDWDMIEITEAEADPGMAANGIVLRENVVILSQGNRRVVRALEKKGVDVIEIDFSGVNFWQGSIDCCTSELWRE